MKRYIIQLLGGFPDIDSAINHIKEINDLDKKREILTEAVKKLYNAINVDDILQQQKDGWLFQGKPLTSVEVQQLREEANYISGMKLWRAIKLDIRWQLSKKMFEDARVQDDLVWGQLLMFLDDIIRQRIKKMK